jgi:hypothetical protein
VSGSRKLYNTLVILLHLMDVIAPKHLWRGRMKDLMSQHEISVAALGFPLDWKTSKIWADPI